MVSKLKSSDYGQGMKVWNIQSLGICAVVGTLGYLSLSEASFVLRFLFSPEGLASLVLDSADGWTDCLTGDASGPLSRDGLEEEYLLHGFGLKERVMLVEEVRGRAETMMDDCGAVAATRRTEQGNIVPPARAVVRGYQGVDRGMKIARCVRGEVDVFGKDGERRMLARLVALRLAFGHRLKSDVGRQKRSPQ